MSLRTYLGWTLLVVCLFAVPDTAKAFCGFMVNTDGDDLYADATQVALFRDGTHTILTMQNNYRGPLEDFAMVVPVPEVLSKKTVKTLPYHTLKSIDRFTTPRLVEYYRGQRSGARLLSATLNVGKKAKPRPKVKVEAEFNVDEYNIIMLSATDSSALETWLTGAGYTIPKGAAKYFQPYVQAGSYFFVARVDISRAKYQNGRALLSPLRFEYTSKDFSLPIRLGLINSDGAQDLIVYVIGETRYEVANRPNGFAPTNIRVDPSVEGQFGSFYRQIFDRIIEKAPDTVVTEYAGELGRSKCDPCSPRLGPLDRSANDLGGDRWLARREPHTLLGSDQEKVTTATNARTLNGALRVPMTKLSACAREHQTVDVPRTIPVNVVTRNHSIADLQFGDPAIAKKPVVKCYVDALIGQRSSLRAPNTKMKFQHVGNSWRGNPGWTITRLHARVDRGGSTADLRFRQAPAIYGGRQVFLGKQLERGAKVYKPKKDKAPIARILFQSRFIIYHSERAPDARRAGSMVAETPNEEPPKKPKKIDVDKVIRAEDMRRVKL